MICLPFGVTVHFAQLLFPLDPPLILFLFCMGIVTGVGIQKTKPAHHIEHVYFALSLGSTFYIPYIVYRSLAHTVSWERLVGSYVLWIIYSLGIGLGAVALRWYNRRSKEA